MGMHLDPVPSGGREYNQNDMAEQNLERETREVEEEREAESKKPGFFKRLFGKKS